MAETVLNIKNLTFGYTKDNFIFENFSLELKKGEIVSIVGPSGSGKSTLFELICGSLKPKTGTIEKKRFSMIFQDPYTSFSPTYSILEQIGDVCNFEEGELLEYLNILRLQRGLLERKPFELSGGQLQRCSILRAILFKSELILADEPTSALDNIIGLEVMKSLVGFLDRVGMVIVTHDISLAKWASDKIVDISKDK